MRAAKQRYLSAKVYYYEIQYDLIYLLRAVPREADMRKIKLHIIIKFGTHESKLCSSVS